MSPVIEVTPVVVMAVLANITKLPADNRLTAVVVAELEVAVTLTVVEAVDVAPYESVTNKLIT